MNPFRFFGCQRDIYRAQASYLKKEEMQNLVNELAAARKSHIDTIENLTLNNIS